MKGYDVAVIGGGVIGCAVARHVARQGASTVVLERGTPGAEASHAAAGMLAPLAEADGPGPFLDLLRAGAHAYPDFVADLARETGIDCGYRTEGTLLVSLREADDAPLEHRYRWQSDAGLPVERLERDAALQLEPGLAPTLRKALLFPLDRQLDNRLRARALPAAAAAAGADFRLGEPAGVRHDGARVTGATFGGDEISAATVVIAAGAWSGTIAGAPDPPPVRPVRGQILALDVLPLAFTHTIDSLRGYLVPRSDGRLIVGATVEAGGWSKALTPRGVGELLEAAVQIAPALADAPIVELWAGLRPGTPDGLPVLGPDPRLGGLLYASGHYRNGILLAPLTGQAIGELALGRPSPIELEAFSPARFR
ncbi:glycine oxidase ThiO [soil metagenome]